MALPPFSQLWTAADSTRYRPLLLAAFVSLLFPFLFFFWQLPSVNAFLSHLQNFLHLPAFALLLFTLRWILREFESVYVDLAVAMVALSIGVVIELVQPSFGRSASWLDIALDTAGICTGFAAWLVFSQRLAKPWLLLCMFILCGGLYQPGYWLFAQWQREQLFPVMLDFDHTGLTAFAGTLGKAELTVAPAPSAWPDTRSQVGRLRFRPSSWPGIHFQPVVADWRPYGALSLEVFSPVPYTVWLSVRVDDSRYVDGSGDNFDRHFPIQPGVNRLHIPLDDIRNGPPERPLNLGEITQVLIYMAQPEQAVDLYLDNLKLETANLEGVRLAQ